jgi:hypothetical protein
MILHHRTHPEFVEGCFACKITGVGFGAAAMPTRKPQVIRTDQRQKQWDRDMPEYKALREQGYQPKNIDGCDELAAKAQGGYEINGIPKLAEQAPELVTGGENGVVAVKQILEAVSS